jgi:hypothetical protein
MDEVMEPTQIMTFGDVRRIIVETIMDVRSGAMPASTALAIAANMKVLNDSVQTEINAAKVSMLAHEKGHDFGRVVGMGQRLIGTDGGGR